MKRLNVLVTACGSVLGIEIIKTLKMSEVNHRLICTDYFKDALGLYWGEQAYLLPDVLNKKLVSEEEWLKEVISIIRAESIDIVFIGIDFEVELFSKYKNQIESKTNSTVVVSDYDKVMVGRDKWKTVCFLEEHNFPFPLSCLPDKVDNLLLKKDFPLVVKPRFGNRSKDFHVVNNLKELHQVLLSTPMPIVQEYLPNEKQEFTCGALYYNEVLSIVTLKRDLKLGNTFRAYSDDYPEIDAYIKQVTMALQPFGPANYQLRLTEKGPVIFEINPRFSGTTSMRALFGINEIDILLKKIFDNHFDKIPEKRKGVIMRYYENYYLSWEMFNNMGK